MAKRGVRKSSSARSFKRNVSKRDFYRSRGTPISVKIVSIFFYITAILSFIIAVLALGAGILGASLVSAPDIQQILNSYPGLSSWGIQVGTGIFVAIISFGVFILVLGLIEFFIARGLWRGNKFSFVLATVLIVLGFLSSLGVLIGLDYSGIGGMILYIILGYCLFINKQAREFFDLQYFSKKHGKRR